MVTGEDQDEDMRSAELTWSIMSQDSSLFEPEFEFRDLFMPTEAILDVWIRTRTTWDSSIHSGPDVVNE